MKKLFLLLLLLLALSAQAADEYDDVGSVDKTKVQALRAQLATPKGLTESTRDFWTRQWLAADQLGDVAALGKIIESALIELKDNKDGTTFFLKRRLLWMVRTTGRSKTYFDAYEAYLPRDPQNPSLIFSLAIDYVAVQNFARAQALLDEVDIIIRTKNWQPRDQKSIEYERARVLINLALAQGRHAEAAQLAKDNIPKADWLLANAGAGQMATLTSHQRQRIVARLSFARAKISGGQYTEARQTIMEAAQLVSAMTLGVDTQVDIWRYLAEIEQAEGNFKRALQLQHHAEARLREAGYHEDAPPMRWVRGGIVNSLIGLQQFSEAEQFSGQIKLSNTTDRILLLWRKGELATALRIAQDEVLRMTEQYGSEHYFTLRSLGLQYAISLPSGKIPERLLEMASLCEKILASKVEQARSPIEHSYRRQIYEAYLQALAESGLQDRELINTGFRMVDDMRDSVVGRVLVDAAQRAVSKQSALSELLSRQSIIKGELTASYDNLAKTLSRDKSERDEKVLAGLRRDLQIQQEESLQLERDIARRFPEYNQFAHGASTQMQDITRLLGRGEAFICILPGATSTYVWVLTRDQAPLFYSAKLGTAEIGKLVGSLRKTLDISNLSGTQIPTFDTNGSRALYTSLLGPAQRLLANRTQLIVNAGGALAQIPFGILIEAQPAADGNPTWLAQRFAITHISSNSAFSSVRQSSFREAARRPFIGFADPLFGRVAMNATPGKTRGLVLNRANAMSSKPDEFTPALNNYAELPPLPETRDEALSLAALLGADAKKDVYLGKSATRDAVLQASLVDYQIVAFSTHGLMAGDLPGLNQPALAMAFSEKDGGATFLTLEDVMGLKLNADWVILSACNTAAGEGEASEALSGLGRGFFYAGARALLVTHWAVETESAKQLVTEVFKRYSGDKSISRSEALRRAQLNLIDTKKYAHPFYWAPYALVGDGG